ncbi:hypothetical protein C5688_13565 [Methylocystis sp. MitZ-2018]|nr:hypothetical protein C5688_13565 [Methylocystis sp. MitZ-2018]
MSPPLTQGSETDDSCAILPKLRAAYYSLLAGSQAEEIQFRERRIRYHRADARALQSEIRRLESICGVYHGPKRYAIRAGGYQPQHGGFGWRSSF